MAKFILAALAAAFLAACGGGGGGDSPTSQPSSCTPRVVSVALLGDSTQYGSDGSTGLRAIDNPGERLQADMDAKFGAGAVVVTDYGVPGSVSEQIPVVEANVEADVKVANPGINDMRTVIYGVPINTPAAVAQFKATMASLQLTIVETQSPIPTGADFGEADYVAADLSLGLPVADVYHYVLSLPNWQSHIHDGYHPDDALYILIVDNVLAPAVAKQVAPLRCVIAK